MLCLALAATVILFIATAVRYVRKLLKHTQKSATGLAAATFFSYVFGVALFMMCVGGSAEMEGGNMVVTVNGATVAGLVLGGLFIVASAVSAVVCGINRSNAKQVALNGVTGTVAAVFAMIIAGVAANGMFGMTGNTATAKICTQCSALQNFSICLARTASLITKITIIQEPNGRRLPICSMPNSS